MNREQFGALQRSIKCCTRCVDRGFISSAYPVLFGSMAARIMILGQAPGPTAAYRPLPYTGASGKTLQMWLRRAGFEDGALHDPTRFYLTSITKCFPGRSSSGKGDRAPGREEIALCSAHLDRELRSVQPMLVLALGRLSIGTMLPSVRRETLASIVGVTHPVEYRAAGDARVLPLPHPSGVSRWHNERSNQTRLAKALDRLDRLRREWLL